MKTVGVSATYSENITHKQVLKKNVDPPKLNEVLVLQRSNHVSIKKQNDVRKLMKFFPIANETEQFLPIYLRKQQQWMMLKVILTTLKMMCKYCILDYILLYL